MNIFFVSRGWPSEREPQWGCFERDQALALSQLGHHIVVLSVDVRFRKYYRKYGITKEIDGDIVHYDLFAGSIWGRILRTISINLYIKVRRCFFLFLFEKVIKEEGLPDLIYAHYLNNSSMALAAKQKYGIPVVGIEHWSELGYQHLNKSIKYWAGKIYNELDFLLTVSSALRENILKNFDIDSVVVNNMVGQEFCYESPTRQTKKVKFVTVGNLIPRKSIDDIIEAFHMAQLPPKKWIMEIVGDGPEKNKIATLIKKYNLGENIKMLGAKDRAGVIEILRCSDVFILASSSETFGVVAIEALACGLPTISTDCGGTKDIISEENGLMCPVHNIVKLSEGINYMFNHYQNYNRKRIADDCQKRFSSEAIAKRLIDIFEKVMEETRHK